MSNKKAKRNQSLGFQSGGEGGIRTRGGLLTHTRFPGVRLKPLIHLSAKPCIVASPQGREPPQPLDQPSLRCCTCTIFMAELMRVATSVMLLGTTRVVVDSWASLL